MGGSQSQVSQDSVRVDYEIYIDGKWVRQVYRTYPLTSIINDVIVDAEIEADLSLSSTEQAVVYIRGPYRESGYTQVLRTERFSNLAYTSDAYDSQRFHLRFGKIDTCPGVCQGPTNVIGVESNADGTHTFFFTDGSQFTTDDYAGTGTSGNSITSIVDNGDGTITINMTDLPPFTTSNFTGPQGIQGIPGMPGIDGDSVTNVSYDAATGVLTFTVTNAAGVDTLYTTGDLRAPAGTGGLSIDFSVINPNGSVTIQFTNGQSVVIPGAISIASVADIGGGILRVTLTDSSTVDWLADVSGTITASGVLQPILDKVVQNSDGGHTAYFAYSLSTSPVAFQQPVAVPTNYLAIAGTDFANPNEVVSYFWPTAYQRAFEYTWNTPNVVTWFIEGPDGVTRSVAANPSNAVSREGIAEILPKIYFNEGNVVTFGYHNKTGQTFGIAIDPVVTEGNPALPTPLNQVSGVFSTTPTSGAQPLVFFPGEHVNEFSFEASPGEIVTYTITHLGRTNSVSFTMPFAAPP